MNCTSSLPGKAALWLSSIAVLLASGATAARGQSALDGFDPNANGTVRVIVVQPDGKTLIGGDFTTLSPNGGVSVTRNHIARLNTDGTLDTAFNPNASGPVFAIVVQGDGKIIVAGNFNGVGSIGGQSRGYLARLDSTTGLADSFNPNANGIVRSIAVQADGKIVAGGDFNGTNSIGGQTRNYIARIDATTGLADSFDPNASFKVEAIAVQADGKILVGGLFNGANSIGGLTRNYVARFDATTGQPDSLDPNANGPVQSFALQADGKILVGGWFSSIGGQTRNHIARVDPATGLADTFNPNANGDIVNTVAVQADGKVLVGGDFNGTNSIGGQMRDFIARLDPATGLADSFNPNANGNSFFGGVFAIAVRPDGKILIGGDFTALAPNSGATVTRNHIARLETDGRLDQTLDLSITGTKVYTTAVQPDGKILIGGLFSTVLGVARRNIARLNTDGTLDMAFDPGASSDVNSVVYAIAVQADGRILVGGGFSGVNSIGGQTRNYIARLDATTGLADSFDPNANGYVSAIALQADGKILVGGAFNGGANSIGGQTRNFIARLDPATGLADSFNPNAIAAVLCIAVQADGKVLAGGNFSAIGGQTRSHIARIDATSGSADPFDPNANDNVFTIAVQPDGKILVGGNFNGTNSIGGQSRNYIARLDATTGLADSFDPNASAAVYTMALQADGQILVGGNFGGANSIGGQTRNHIARLDATNGLADSFNPNANDFVSTISVQADGKILVGGFFSGTDSIGGQTRSQFARLNNDTLALQDLAVSQTTATWTRGGSSPQFTHVTFEDSTDGLNYNFLGSGKAAGSNWTLTSLNLSMGQNLYIRARGYYPSGVENGSESLTESVRNAFLNAPATTPPPLLNIQRNANTNVVLSWSTNSTGFTLEANTNLNTSVWSIVSPAPAVLGTNNVVTNAVSGSTRFYRLRK